MFWANLIIAPCLLEAGARWFEGMLGDAGSPLTVLHYLEALRETRAPFVPVCHYNRAIIYG